jgi:hypothetical protein
MENYVLRVWLPDRPGALGAVASRIGAVKGDVVGIDILEVGAGQAVDELVVRLPDATLVDLLVNEVRQVDGVAVEEVRAIGFGEHDPKRATLETALALVAATERQALLEVARDVAPASLSASWIAVLDLSSNDVLVAGERAPSHSWLAAFVQGASDGQGGDVIWTPMPEGEMALVAGRDGIAWRARERRELDALAHILAIRWTELSA